MLYVVGKMFLYGITFNIIYNESGHKNIYLNVLTEFTNILIFLKQRWRGMNKHCIVIHTYIYIYQIVPFKHQIIS